MKEQRVGVVNHYYNNISVATVIMENEVTVGDTIHIKGNTSDFIQKVESIQLEHKNINQAKKGENVGIKVKEHAREHDVVYKVVEE